MPMKPTPMPKKPLPKNKPVPMPTKPVMPKKTGMAYGGMAEKTMGMTKPMGMAKGGMTKKAPAKKGKK